MVKRAKSRYDAIGLASLFKQYSSGAYRVQSAPTISGQLLVGCSIFEGFDRCGGESEEPPSVHQFCSFEKSRVMTPVQYSLQPMIYSCSIPLMAIRHRLLNTFEHRSEIGLMILGSIPNSASIIM